VCGCNKAKVATIPMTSGDLADSTMAAAEPGVPRFKIVTNDPATGAQVTMSEHPDYQSARQAQSDSGGRLRSIDA
jgi:hypothetical protein